MGKAPQFSETKKIHKNQFGGTSAHSFRQGSVTWFLVSGDADWDMDEDGDVNGDCYGDTDLGMRVGMRMRMGM